MGDRVRRPHQPSAAPLPRATAAGRAGDADIPELTTLAEAIVTWWAAVEVLLATGLTNAAPRAPTD
ncbi:MAG TPA: hypothetical protein VIY28_11600 [Pseudonocardiaceae bacterium]